jgi:hypothetical protein
VPNTISGDFTNRVVNLVVAESCSYIPL